MSPSLMRAVDPAVREIAERRRLLCLSQPMLGLIASVSAVNLAKAERGIGRPLRPDELARLEFVLSRVEAVRAEAAGLARRSA